MLRKFIFISCVVGSLAGFANLASAQMDPDRVDHVALNGFGIEFSGPKGWQRTKEATFSELARFALIRGNSAAGFMLITAGSSKGRSAADMANQLATTSKGKVLPSTNAKNGMIEIELPASANFPENRAGVIPAGDRIVIIQVGGADPGAAAAALKAVNESIALTAPKPAMDTLELPEHHEVQISDSPVLMPLPEAFRPDSSKPTPNQTFYGARDWVSLKDEASIIVQSVPNTKHATMAAFIPLQESALTTRLKLTEPMKFEKVADKPETYLSNIFSTSPSDSQRIICTVTDADHIALMIFRTTAIAAAGRDAYMKIADEMSHPLRISEAYKQAVDAAKNGN